MTKESTSQYSARNELTDHNAQRDGDAEAQKDYARSAEDAL